MTGPEDAPESPATAPEEDDLVALVNVVEGRTTLAKLWWPWSAIVALHPDEAVAEENLARSFDAVDLQALVNDVRAHLDSIQADTARDLVVSWRFDHGLGDWDDLARRHRVQWRDDRVIPFPDAVTDGGAS